MNEIVQRCGPPFRKKRKEFITHPPLFVKDNYSRLLFEVKYAWHNSLQNGNMGKMPGPEMDLEWDCRAWAKETAVTS